MNGFTYNNNGGDAGNCGEAGAYCIIQQSVLLNQPRRHLLAHELGHVIGLRHPNGELPAGSPNSVMAEVDQHNTGANSGRHCRFLKSGTNNPLIRTTFFPDCFLPDIED